MNDKELEELTHAEFWDARYVAEKNASRDSADEELGSFEWFRSFEDLRPFFVHLPPPASACHILHLGCGNSSLTADLHHLGYTRQTSVDFSQVVIDAMRAKYAALGQEWRVMDVRSLEVRDASVDVAVDKSTLDAMIHGSLWDPPDDVCENVRRYVDEVARVLRPGAQWLYITYRQPHFMRRHLEREGVWTASVEVLEQAAGAFEYFGWIMRKL